MLLFGDGKDKDPYDTDGDNDLIDMTLPEAKPYKDAFADCLTKLSDVFFRKHCVV